MKTESVRDFFQESPTIRLLRSDLAPHIMPFFHQTFKVGDEISIGHADLLSLLATFQEELHESHPTTMRDTPESYLASWSEKNWLLRFLDASHDEPQYQLTSYTEEALHFVDSATDREQFVGTEGRLKFIMETLADIVRGSARDPRERLEHLKKTRNDIERRIAAIEEGQTTEAYEPTQLRERFSTAVNLLKTLQADFRAVEERFEQIARNVHEKQIDESNSRGDILGFALEAEEHLKKTDEGSSFFAFVAFLISPEQQSELRENINQLQQIAALKAQSDSLALVKRMVPNLLSEADKVMKTAARLSATLRKLLDARASKHRLRVSATLREIKIAASALRDSEPEYLEEKFQCFTTVTPRLDISSPFTRTFWKPTDQFLESDPQQPVVDITQVDQIAHAFSQLKRLDLKQLKSTVREATLGGKQATLADIVTYRPLEHGIVELLGYLQIAYESGHAIDSSITQEIEIETSAGLVIARVPTVIFQSKAKMRPACRLPK